MSRTRDLLPEALFKEVFEEILRQCINAGLVSGHTQVVDSAPVKANLPTSRQVPAWIVWS
jgi:hypothetical protein